MSVLIILRSTLLSCFSSFLLAYFNYDFCYYLRMSMKLSFCLNSFEGLPAVLLNRLIIFISDIFFIYYNLLLGLGVSFDLSGEEVEGGTYASSLWIGFV